MSEFFTPPASSEYDDWLAATRQTHLRSSLHRGERCLGSLVHISTESRLRGIRAVALGECRSISRVMTPRDSGVGIEVRAAGPDDYIVGTETLTIDCHGMARTHLDGLSHFGRDGVWHGGSPAVRLAGEDILAWAEAGISTRALIVDIPRLRGVEWVQGAPVEADEIESCLVGQGVAPQAGDALIVYMGRDRYEAAGHRYGTAEENPDGRPGLGASVAPWIVDNGISLLAWDFLDAAGPGIPHLATHALIWAVGLAIIDNCDLGEVVRDMSDRSIAAGLLTVAPLRMAGTTGAAVNPLLHY